MTEKDDILERLARLSVDELDKLRDKKQVELRQVMVKYYTTRDEAMVYKYQKRKELMAEGNSLSKVENMLRSDEGIFNHKRLVLEYSALKQKLELELKIVEDFYWKARQ